MPLVKMTIKEAADKLLENGAITQEECEHIKEAAFKMPKLPNMQSISDNLQGIGMTALGLGVLKQILTPVVQRAQAGMAFNKLVDKVPSLSEKDPEKVKDYFKVVQTFSPKAATNPLVAGALVNKMMEFGGVDHKLVQDISSIQAGVAQAEAMKNLMGAASKTIYGKQSAEQPPVTD